MIRSEMVYSNPVEILKPRIEVLLNQITNQFPRDLQKKVRSSNISIEYDNRPVRARTPRADLVTHVIEISETYLAFLWSCSYATVAFNTMYYEMAGRDDLIRLQDHTDFLKASLTLGWGKSLLTEVSMWPDKAARPDVLDKWAESANNLFEVCVTYLLFHEIGHVILHENLSDLMKLVKDPYYELSDEDRLRIYKAEVEADRFAIRRLIGTSVKDEVILMKYLGALLAQLSNFYLLNTPDTRGGTHPDLDVRLRSLINNINLREEANQIQMKAHTSVGLQLFFAITGKEIDSSDKMFDTFEELEEYMFGIIDEMKAAARGH